MGTDKHGCIVLEPVNDIVIGVDLGGTKVAGAVFDKGSMISPKSIFYIGERKGGEVGRLVTGLIEQLLGWAEEKGLDVSATGVAVPGIYNAGTGRVWAPNIAGWEDYPLKQELGDGLDSCQALIDSDRSCYILGEAWVGAAKDCRNAVYLAVGTGIGAGIMVDGRILRGADNIAGAAGWLALTDPWLPGYTDCGCFEYHASGTGISRMAGEKAGGSMTAGEVFKAYGEGDPVAAEVIGQCIRFWGKAAANLVSLLNPEKIIFGGGVFGPAAALLNDIRGETRKWAQPISLEKVSFEASLLGQDAGLYGAARLALLKDEER